MDICLLLTINVNTIWLRTGERFPIVWFDNLCVGYECSQDILKKKNVDSQLTRLLRRVSLATVAIWKETCAANVKELRATSTFRNVPVLPAHSRTHWQFIIIIVALGAPCRNHIKPTVMFLLLRGCPVPPVATPKPHLSYCNVWNDKWLTLLIPMSNYNLRSVLSCKKQQNQLLITRITKARGTS